MSADCVFCEIVDGRSPASVAFEDTLVLCLMDAHPVNAGHLLVIPKQHVATLDEVSEETGAHLFRIALRMQRALRLSEIACDGVNLLLSDGESAGQDVPHIHLHVVPRLPHDGFRITTPVRSPTRSELDQSAAAVRAAYPG